MAHDAGDGVDCLCELDEVLVWWDPCVEDEVLLIGEDEPGGVCADVGVELEVGERAFGVGEAEVEYFDGERCVLTELLDAFSLLDEVDASVGCAGDDFLSRHGAAEAFDHVEVWVDLVCAVEEVVDGLDVFHGDDSESERCGECCGGFAGCNARSVEESLVGACCECMDCSCGCFARAESDGHVVLDGFDGCLCEWVWLHAVRLPRGEDGFGGSLDGDGGGGGCGEGIDVG